MKLPLFKSLALLMLRLCVGCLSKDSRRPKIEALKVLLIDSATIINTKEIDEERPFALVYFSPDCDECQKETEQIIKHMDILRDYKFYFITGDPFVRLKVFSKFYNIPRYPNIILGQDVERRFSILYQATGTPFTVVFDHKKRLRTIFNGAANMETLISVMKKLDKTEVTL